MSTDDGTMTGEWHCMLIAELGSARPATAVDVPVCNTACLSANGRA